MNGADPRPSLPMALLVLCAPTSTGRSSAARLQSPDLVTPPRRLASIQATDAHEIRALPARDGSIPSHRGLVRPAALLTDPDPQDVFQGALRFSPKAGDGRVLRRSVGGDREAQDYHAAAGTSLPRNRRISNEHSAGRQLCHRRVG